MSLSEVCVCRRPRVYVCVWGNTWLSLKKWFIWKPGSELKQKISSMCFHVCYLSELIVLDLFIYIVLISVVGRQSMMMENHNCPQKHIITHWPERTPCSLRRWMKLIVSTEMLRYYCTWMIEWNRMNENMNERINQWLSHCALAAYQSESSHVSLPYYTFMH